MSKFRDKLGREWTLEVTMGSAAQVEQDTGADLLKWAEGKGEVEGNRTVFKVVGSLCAEQIADRGLTARQFGDGFDGPALERAAESLMEAMLFFVHPAKVAKAALPKMKAAMAQAHDKAAREIRGQDWGNAPAPDSES